MSLDIRIQDTFANKYLGEWDLPEDGKDLIVQIEDVEEEDVVNPKTNTKTKEIVLHFKGNVNPMILSSKVNKQNLRHALGTGRTLQWIGKKIQLYREQGVWFGEPGFAVRIRDFAPEA